MNVQKWINEQCLSKLIAIILVTSTLVAIDITKPAFAQRQQSRGFSVSGHCYDNSTGIGVPADISVVVNQRPIKIGNSNEEGDFKIRVPLTATHIQFRASGYQSLSIPIHFPSNIPGDIDFLVYNMAMVPNNADPLPLSHYSALVASFDIDTTAELVNYELIDLDRSKTTRSTVFNKKKHYQVESLPVSASHYRARYLTKQGKLLYSEDFTIRNGITFKTVQIRKIDRKVTPSIVERSPLPRDTTPTVRLLTFELGSYELREFEKALLDTVTKRLVLYPSLKVALVGYSENIGKRESNVTLSEYRAKTVKHYLINKGINRDRISTRWKGPDIPASMRSGIRRCVTLELKSEH